ncbi:MAG: YitT family protein, partial [Candidatus Cloacimonadota bacterium]|nr:YitT family protein [Candidatus Cloacimonadota bacterium]
MINNIRRNIVQYLGMIIGAFLLAISYSWFLVPYKIVPGGIGGLSQILFHIFEIPVGISMLLLNFPLFIISFIFMGKRFGFRSLYGMVLVAIFTDLVSITNLHKLGIIKNLSQYTFLSENGKTFYALLNPDDIYLAAIAGSVLLGAGLGIIFRFKGSTGGTDIPVALIKSKTGLSIGTGYWIVETFIILTVGIVFKDMKLVIWGYINLFITSKITDLTSEGLPYVKGVYIISEKNELIKTAIFKYINRGVTFIKAESGYTGKPINMLFCAMNRRQVAVVRDLIKDI